MIRRQRIIPGPLTGDPVLRVAAGAGLLYLVAYAVLNARTADHRSAAVQLAVDFLAVAVLAAPVAVLVTAALRQRRQGRNGLPWALFATSTLLTAAGSVLSVGHDEAPGHAGLMGLAGNVLLVAASLTTVAGFFAALSPGARTVRLWMGFDLVLAVAGIAAFVGQLASVSDTPSLAAGVRATSLVYAISGITTGIFLMPLAFRVGRHVPAALRLVGAAYLVSAIVDGAMLRAVLTGHPYREGSWLSVGYQLALVLLTLGGLIAARSREDIAIQLPDRRERDVPLSAAAAGIAVAGLGLVSVDHLRAPQLVAALVVAGLLVRLWLVLRERTRLADRLGAALAEQQQLAVTDGLTGLPNRRHFENALTTEIVRARRSGRPLSLVVLDLDHFKKINDVHGHPAGDAVLVQVAGVFEQVTRGGDVVARYGGEEFVWLLPDTTEDGAAIVAERLRTTLSANPIELPCGGSLRVTASIGLATGILDARKLLATADQALYRAKAAGRNQVVRASTVAPVAIPRETEAWSPASADVSSSRPVRALAAFT